jgi:hypothetical protein
MEYDQQEIASNKPTIRNLTNFQMNSKLLSTTTPRRGVLYKID